MWASPNIHTLLERAVGPTMIRGSDLKTTPESFASGYFLLHAYFVGGASRFCVFPTVVVLLALI
jgi:hypothetical protein